MAGVLHHRFDDEAVLVTIGNSNNHIGLPLALLKLDEEHRYAVIEMSINHFGELPLLIQIAGPNIALANNILRVCVSYGFNGVGGIAGARSETYEGLLSDDVALIPCGDASIATFGAVTIQLSI